MSIGSFCLVLHAHMPYVLHHGHWPHGEDWLYEAAAETYLPLLAMIAECRQLNAEPRITLGLTPILLEQLDHEHFKQGFGIKRFTQHVSRFEFYTDLAQAQAVNAHALKELTPVQQSELREAELHDVVFSHIDLDWWNAPQGVEHEHYAEINCLSR